MPILTLPPPSEGGGKNDEGKKEVGVVKGIFRVVVPGASGAITRKTKMFQS